MAYLIAVGAVALMIGLYVAFDRWLNKRISGKYDWKPDLSHKVLYSEWRPEEKAGGDMRMTLIEKSPEERLAEHREYLKERNQ